MDKIQKAQELADQMLDEASIRQVGDDKGALKDKPESIKKSEEDLEDYVEMEESELFEDEFFNEADNSIFSDNPSHEVKKIGLKKAFGGNVKFPNTTQKEKNKALNKLSSTMKADHHMNMAKFHGKQAGFKESQISKMVSNIQTYLGEEKEVKVSDVPKDKQKIFKINRGKAREKGGPLTKAEKGGKPIKECNQTAIAQQKDTLFDNLERIVKPKTDKKTSLNPEPTSENWFKSLQKKGKEIMMGKRKKGLKLTQKKDKALKKVMKG